MRTPRQGLADRVRKIGVAIEETVGMGISPGVIGSLAAGESAPRNYLAIDMAMAGSLLDAAQALDVIAAARAQLPARIPRADMMVQPAAWAEQMNLLLQMIDSVLATSVTAGHPNGQDDRPDWDQITRNAAEMAVRLLQENRNGCLTKLTEAMARDIVATRPGGTHSV